MSLPPLNEIQIIDDWPDDSHEVTVCVIHSNSEQIVATNNFNRFDYDELINIHIYVKQLTEDRPPLLGMIEKEITRIILSNATALSVDGVSLMIPNQFVDLSNRDNTSVYWHSMMEVRLIYRKFVT